MQTRVQAGEKEVVAVVCVRVGGWEAERKMEAERGSSRGDGRRHTEQACWQHFPRIHCS